MTNGGVTWRDLQARERDALVEIARLDRRGEEPIGADVRRALQENGYEEFHDTYIYRLIDGLVEKGLVNRQPTGDRRAASKRLEVTGTGRSVMQWHCEKVASQLGMELRRPGGIVTGGGRA